MKRWTLGLWTAFAVVSALNLAHANGRHAVVIGTNRGLPTEPVLEFAESDARRVAQTFVDVEAVARDQVTLVTGRSLEQVKLALHEAPAVEELWVFISGHAARNGVHVAGEVWPWKELRHALESHPAQRRVAFIDSCNSGAVLTAKGISLESQLRLAVRSNLHGLVVLVSSGANELSYESLRLRGSPFAHFLESGLRGAGDQDRDGRITVAEVYGYLYSRTVAASLSGSSGPQHPEQAGWYRGNGQWVLSERAEGQGELRLSDASLGTCYVLDQDETRVLAELRASDPAPLALPTRRYRLRCVSGAGARAVSLELGMATVVVESLDFESVPNDLMLARGPSNPAIVRWAAAGGMGFVDPTPVLLGTVAAIVDRQDFSYELQVGLRSDAHFMTKAALYGRLPWWEALDTRLDVGLSVGHDTRFDGAGEVVFGPLIQLSTPLGESSRWFLRQEILRSVPLSPEARAALPLFTTTGIDVSWSD